MDKVLLQEFLFEVDLPLLPKEIDLAISFAGESGVKRIVLMIEVKSKSGEEISSSCSTLSYSRVLESMYMYAPSAPNRSICHAAQLTFEEPIASVKIRPLAWPSAVPVGHSLIDGIYIGYKTPHSIASSATTNVIAIKAKGN